ncbi:glycerophosphodiester phosphodiesterase family protein [Salipaludibacillus sp. HK11]|uniref:glycerophosphodiester phosphodiesterase family protein n=1 Tax=Salipaludibacillus sp. HK11 TaxID=3394320 RepID=UPI0039FCFDEB
MLAVLKNSLQDFYLSYKKYLAFALLYMLVTSIIFVPFISFLFNRVLKAIGTGSLLNAEVYRIGLSSIGLAGMLLISFLIVVILFIEFGVMIIIAQQTYFKKYILISEAFVTTLRKLPALIGLGIIPLMFIFFMIIPFIDSPVFPALLDFNASIILTDQIYGMSTIVMLLFIVVFLLGIFFFTRLIFTLHYIFIERNSVWKAMKQSWKITKYNKRNIIVTILMLNVLFYVSGFLVVTLISFIPNLTEITMLRHLIDDYLLTFSSFTAVIISLLFLPINIIITTRLFFRFKKRRGEFIKNQLIVHEVNSLAKFEHKLTHFFTKRKYTLVAVVIIYVTSVFAINYSVNDQLVYLKWNVQVAAHRGDLHSAPENSLSSIEAAVEQGVDAVEIDVMITTDGVIVLHHDETLQRLAGVPDRLEDMTYEEVAEVDIGRLYSNEFIGETIPTLNETLEMMSEENVNVIIDIKLNDIDRRSEMAVGVVDSIEEHDMEDTAYVQAFDNEILKKIRSGNSNIKIGQILFLSAGNLESLDVDFYTIRQTMLTERFIENAKEQDREVWVWTVNIPRNISAVLKYDIDGIITDYPERVQRMTGLE